LAKNADIFISSEHPDTCRIILTASEMLDESPHKNEPGLFVGVGKALPTHFIVALIWAGYAQDDDNGYKVYCLPKKTFTEGMAAAFVAFVMRASKGRTRKGTIEWIRKVSGERPCDLTP
jgi:hypothetical protein